MGSFSSQSAPIVAIVVLLIESQEMFSRIVSSSGSRLARQFTRPARGFARFANSRPAPIPRELPAVGTIFPTPIP